MFLFISDPGVCPSSVAKYFHDLGYNVEERSSVISQSIMLDAMMPALKLDQQEADPEDVMEWIGCHTLGIRL